MVRFIICISYLLGYVLVLNKVQLINRSGFYVINALVDSESLSAIFFLLLGLTDIKSITSDIYVI